MHQTPRHQRKKLKLIFDAQVHMATMYQAYDAYKRDAKYEEIVETSLITLRANLFAYYNYDSGPALRPSQVVAALQTGIISDVHKLLPASLSDISDVQKGAYSHRLVTSALSRVLHRQLNYITLLHCRGRKDHTPGSVTQGMLDATFAKTLQELEAVDIPESLRKAIKGKILKDRDIFERIYTEWLTEQ
jgi:hypothetical protein